MAFTIYTISDPVVIGSAMTSMAMFFGQESLVGSIVKTGLLISLLFILGQTVVQKGLRLDVILIQLIVVWVVFLPKTTVNIEQFDNSAPPRVVDNVPYAIALPATLAGSFALMMTNRIEQVMVNVNGDYLSVSGDVHPFSPARVLMSFAACPLEPLGCLSQNLVETMRLAVRYCSGPSLSKAEFANQRYVLKALSETLTETGSTVIYDDGNPYVTGGGGGRAASCSEAASYLRNYEDSVGNGSSNEVTETIKNLANKAEIKQNKAVIRDDGTIDYDTAMGMINKLTDSSSRIDTRSVFNIMTYSMADSLKYVGHTPIDQPISIMRDSGLFNWAKSEASQSMMVSTTAPKFMDVLFFIFIASTPIVMFMLAANPQSGVKVAVSYIVFGLWTQSWIPMMAIITSWYQRDILSIPAPIPPLGEPLSPAYMAMMMRQTMTSTIAAGNMIQNAPYLMFAILTGSMFAMSSMISKAVPSGSGGGATGEASGAGGSSGGGKGSPLVGGAGSAGSPILAQRAAIAGSENAMRGGMTGDSVGVLGDASANLSGLGSIDFGGGVASSANYSSETSAAARKKIEQSQSQALNDTSSLIASGGKYLDGAKVASYLSSKGHTVTWDSGTGTLSSDGQSVNLRTGHMNSAARNAALSGNIQAGLNTKDSLPGKVLGAIGGVSASVGLQASTGVTHGSTQTAALDELQSLRKETSTSAGIRDAASTGENASTGSSGKSGAQWSEIGQKATQLGNTLTQLASSTKALDEADKLSKTAAMDASAKTGAKVEGSDFVNKWGQTQLSKNGSDSRHQADALGKIQNALGGSLNGEALQGFLGSFANNYKQLEQAFGSGMSRDQMAGAAAWKSLSSMNSSANSPSEKLSALSAMAKLATAANIADVSAGVTAAAAAVERVASVERGLAGMQANMTPVIAKTEGAVATGLNPARQNEITASASERIAGSRAAAGGIYGQTVSQTGAVEARGKESVGESHQGNVAFERHVADGSPLINKLDTATGRQQFAPSNDGASYAISDKSQPSEYGVKPGAGSVGTVSSAVSGATGKAINAAGSVAESVTGSASAGADVAKNLGKDIVGSSIQGPGTPSSNGDLLTGGKKASPDSHTISPTASAINSGTVNMLGAAGALSTSLTSGINAGSSVIQTISKEIAGPSSLSAGAQPSSGQAAPVSSVPKSDSGGVSPAASAISGGTVNMLSAAGSLAASASNGISAGSAVVQNVSRESGSTSLPTLGTPPSIGQASPSGGPGMAPGQDVPAKPEKGSPSGTPSGQTPGGNAKRTIAPPK
ncbi:conjugal transfer protein TraG N-terminal domain-containing protein [Delftia sp. JD2]|uniref:conjugal transfer protein TraG N-terminal domain-containing protein n=1 Tax=Delftia sp. JD2 TaxID=469553 RepID=UPI000A063813|nr:conjugal transfer protein TraG N-terminal domain-containing protein [Delftia sp. JD2]